jgi:AcrR family transcriptional regulator
MDAAAISDPPADPQPARASMIAAAERIVAERGLTAMSLRVVQQESGQRNKSAAQYHFGSKEGLVEAIATERMGAVAVRRRALLDAAGAAPSRRELVEALVVPLAEHVLDPERPSHWARFQVQAAHDPAFARAVRHAFEGSAYRDVRDGLLAALDHVPAPLRAHRVDHAVGLVVTSLAAMEGGTTSGAQVGTAGAVPVAARIADLVDIATAVLDAPASSATTAALTARPRRAARPA